MTTLERRREPRIAISESAIVIARHERFVLTMEDISACGARLVGPSTIETGDRIQILCELESAPIDVGGTVIRVEKRGGIASISVDLVEMDEATRKRIGDFVQRSLDVP